MFAPLAGASGLSSSATINSATSSAVRPGHSAGLARRSISVSTAPGLRQMALMPCSLPSTAIASVRPMTPYLDTLYAASPGNFSVAYPPDSDAMLTVPGGEHDVSASRRRGRGGGRPDPAAGPRDDRQPSRQPPGRGDRGGRRARQVLHSSPTSHSPVKTLMRVETQFQVKLALGVLA